MMLVAWLLFAIHSQFRLDRISYRDALVFATLTWLVCGLLGAVPIMLVTGVSYTDAAFESTSALTITGATILTSLDAIRGRTLRLYWRDEETRVFLIIILILAAAACINVLGPGFGAVGSNFQPVSDTGTWILFGAMILGRLEYFTALALFFPGFWTR